MRTVEGQAVAVHCPPWCTQDHRSDGIADHVWHEGPAIALDGPGDHFGQDGPYRVLWACLSAEPDDRTGEYGMPYICLDVLDAGQSARLDVAAADAVIGELRLYVDRLQQLRDRLAAVLAGGEPR